MTLDVTVKKWMKILASVAGGLTAVIGPVFFLSMEMCSRYKEVNAKAEAGYETLAPAIQELQEAMDGAEDWAEDVSDELEVLVTHDEDTERRLSRCESFIETLAERRGMPDLPEIEYPDGPKTWPEDPVADMANGTLHPDFVPKSQARFEKTAKKISRPVPQSINQAQDYQQKRDKEKCSPGDPLCGSDF